MSRPAHPTVQTSSGAVRGFWREGSAAFLGVPYAAAPVGALRFAAPVPVVRWAGERPAIEPGPTPQRRPFAAVTTIPERSVPGEQTLSVNVFTPAPGQPERRLPVLVWVHGGGFTAGWAASPWYDGVAFNRDGVVVVTLSYRLGFDGFGWIEDAPANRGLLDQIAALEWVQANVAAFGGDPDAVTIAGQSAGGSSVMTLLATPGAQHLFASVISQSAAGRTQQLADAERIGRAMADAAGVDPTRAGWSTLTEDEILDLQAPFVFRSSAGSQDPVAVARASLFPADDGLTFGPVVDGELIPCLIEEGLARGTGADKPLLAGTTAHEFTPMLAARADLSGIDPAAVLVQAGLPAEDARDYLIAHRELAEPALQLGQLATERLFRLPLLRWADARSGHAGSRDRTWLYDFRWRSPVTSLALHCSELPFAWDLLDAERVDAALGATPPQHLADVMHAAWVKFVRDRDPGWPLWAERGQGMVFEEDAVTGPVYESDRRLARALAASPPREPGGHEAQSP